MISQTPEDYDPELRGHLEAQIANAADELAYSAHDLDDGLRSGLITPRMLAELEIWKSLVDSIGWNGTELNELGPEKDYPPHDWHGS